MPIQQGRFVRNLRADAMTAPSINAIETTVADLIECMPAHEPRDRGMRGEGLCGTGVVLRQPRRHHGLLLLQLSQRGYGGWRVMHFVNVQRCGATLSSIVVKYVLRVPSEARYVMKWRDPAYQIARALLTRETLDKSCTCPQLFVYERIVNAFVNKELGAYPLS